MKKFLLASLALMAAGSANAADMSMPLKAPLPAAPAYSWTGCYLGVQGGGGFMHDSNVDNSSDPIWHGGGAIAGGQGGCNYQMQQVVVGIEAEGVWSTLRNTDTSNQISTIVLTGGPVGNATRTSTSVVETRNKWDADLALRFGWAFDRLLVYSKAGVAWGGFSFSNNNSINQTCSSPAVCGSFTSNFTTSGSRTLTGMVLGVGVEWAVADHWIARVEGDWINYPRTDVTLTGTSSFVCPTCTPPITTSAFTNVLSEFATKGLIKAALSYKF